MRFAIFRNVLIVFVVSTGLDCKPRRNVSELRGDADFSESVLEIQKEIATIDERYKLYSEGSMPIADESVANYAKSTGGKAGNRIAPPPTCPEQMWNNDISWNNDLVVDLEKKAKESPHFLVRMHAVKVLTQMTSRGAMDCAAQKLDEILFVNNAFRDNPPDQALLLNKGGNATYACTSLLRCSVALEVAVTIGSTFPNSDLSNKMTAAIRNAINAYDLQQVAKEIILYRVDSAEGYVEFMRATQYHDASYHGSSVVLDPMRSQELIQRFENLTKQFYARYSEFLGYPEAIEKNTGSVANVIQTYFVQGDFATKEADDPYDFKDSAKERLMQYTKDFVQPSVDNYRFNLGVRHYIDRLATTDPKVWLDKIKSRVTAGRMVQDEMMLGDDGGAVPQNRIDEIHRSQGIGANELPLDPVAAFMALTTFIDHEIYLPYRSDFRVAIDFTLQQMTRKEKLMVFPKALQVDGTYKAYAEHMKSYGNSVLSMPVNDLQLPEQKWKEVDRMRKTFGRLMAQETDIVRRPGGGWVGFSSVHHQVMRYSNLMVARGAALNRLVDFAKEPWTTQFADKFKFKENPFAKTAQKLKTGSAVADFLLIPKWMQVPIPTVLFNPDNKANNLQFNLDQATGDLIGQYLVIECTDRILTREGRRQKGLDIKNETFFIDDTTIINFRCEENWTYADLSSRAFAYGRKTAQEKIETKLAQNIKDHPLLHTAMMVAMSAVVPHVSVLVLRSIALAARFVPLAVTTAWYARVAIWFGRLAIDSFIFGIGDYYFRSALDVVIGIKLTPQEQQAHASALFNWRGIVTGALIFGIIPFAHGPVDKLVRGVAGPSILGKQLYNRTVQNAIFRTPWNRGAVQKLTSTELTRVGALWLASAGAQMTAETSIFVFHPMLEEEAHKLWLQIKGTYREPGEMEKIWAKLHTPSKAEQVLSSALTVTAFTANRAMGHGIHASGLDYRMDRQLQFWGARQGGRSYTAELYNPYMELALPRDREASKEAVEAAFNKAMEVISKDVKQLQTKNEFSPQTQYIFATEIRRRVLARRMLVGEMDWSAGKKIEVPELSKYGLDFAVSDRKLDKDLSKGKDRESDEARWLDTYEKVLIELNANMDNLQPPQPGQVKDSPYGDLDTPI